MYERSHYAGTIERHGFLNEYGYKLDHIIASIMVIILMALNIKYVCPVNSYYNGSH